MRQVHCPGASLRVTRADYLALRRGGEVFSSADSDVKHDGVSDARIFCNRDVEIMKSKQGVTPEGGAVYALYHAALCSSCAELERTNRAVLAEKAGSRQ